MQAIMSNIRGIQRTAIIGNPASFSRMSSSSNSKVIQRMKMEETIKNKIIKYIIENISKLFKKYNILIMQVPIQDQIKIFKTILTSEFSQVENKDFNDEDVVTIIKAILESEDTFDFLWQREKDITRIMDECVLNEVRFHDSYYERNHVPTTCYYKGNIASMTAMQQEILLEKVKDMEAYDLKQLKKDIREFMDNICNEYFIGRHILGNMQGTLPATHFTDLHYLKQRLQTAKERYDEIRKEKPNDDNVDIKVGQDQFTFNSEGEVFHYVYLMQ